MCHIDWEIHKDLELGLAHLKLMEFLQWVLLDEFVQGA